MPKRPASRSPPPAPNFPLSQNSASFPSIAAAESEDSSTDGPGSSTQPASMRPQAKKQKVESAGGSDPASHGPPLQLNGTFAPKDVLAYLGQKELKVFNDTLTVAVGMIESDADLEKKPSSIHGAASDALEAIPKLSPNVIENQDFRRRLSDPRKRREFFKLLKELEQKGDFRELIVNGMFAT
ncbi:hypothetical protein BC834DRAFT_55755 [Gloeopeniophorella convolvens]|nr:hypothetical protein BC834DRAFT_55755 [Gloeopeniophorella convolvens]